jgi:hypothetical protein
MTRLYQAQPQAYCGVDLHFMTMDLRILDPQRKTLPRHDLHARSPGARGLGHGSAESVGRGRYPWHPESDDQRVVSKASENVSQRC